MSGRWCITVCRYFLSGCCLTFTKVSGFIDGGFMKQLAMLLFLLVVGAYGESQAGERADAVAEKNDKIPSPSGKILRYGIFARLSGGEIVDSAQTSTGKSMSNVVMTFIRQTARIPIKKGRLLAYQYRLSNLPAGRYIKLRRVLKHPSFTLPNGSLTTGSDYVISKKVENNEVFAYDVYGLDEPYEMVEGDWTFQIWFQGKKLLEQAFTTYRADEP